VRSVLRAVVARGGRPAKGATGGAAGGAAPAGGRGAAGAGRGKGRGAGAARVVRYTRRPLASAASFGASAKELGTQSLTRPLVRFPTQAQPKPSQAELDAELDSYMALAPPEAAAGGADAAAPMAA
jgi:hypothetical protein